MTDLPDAVDIAFAGDEPVTLEQIYESVQAQMSGKLSKFNMIDELDDVEEWT